MYLPDTVERTEKGGTYHAFGRARLVDDPEEMRKIHGYIIDKYSKGHEESGGRYLDSSISEIYMVEITVDHITAKTGC